MTERHEAGPASQRHGFSRASQTPRRIDHLRRGLWGELCIFLAIDRDVRIDRPGLQERELVASIVNRKVPETSTDESAADGGQELSVVPGGSIRLHAAVADSCYVE